MSGWAAAAQIGSQVLGDVLGFVGQRNANRANASLMREVMGFEERMSNTAWQRGTADMRRAGINPMLAVSQGPASVPSASPATMQNEFSSFKDLGQKTASALKVAQELKNMKAVEKNLEEDTYLKEAQNRQAQTQANKNISEGLNLQKMGRILDQDLTTAKNAAERADIETEMLEEHPIIRRLGVILRELGLSGNSAITNMSRPRPGPKGKR